MDDKYAYIEDSMTGIKYIPVDMFLRFVRAEKDEQIDRVDLIERMTAVGWRREYIEASNPEDPSEVIGIDMFVIPAGWTGGRG